MKCFLIGGYNDSQQSIEAYIQANFFYIQIYGRINSYSEAEKSIHKIRPELLILDLDEHTENNALNLLKKIRKFNIDMLVILEEGLKITTYLTKNNISFINKPLDHNELRYHLSGIYVKRTKEKELHQILDRIRITAPKKRIAIPQEKQIQMIPISEIMYIEADINYCQVHIQDEKSILVSKTLKSFEQQLINNIEFYRIHQSYLINLNYISKIIKTKLPQVIMTNGDILTVSRSKKTDFLNHLLK